MTHSDTILHCVEAFLDTHPSLEESTLEFGTVETGENASVKMMSVTIDGDEYLVVAKRVGGEA